MRLPQPIWTRFLPTGTVLALATLGPVGRRLPAPGTWGSVAGVLYFIVVYRPFGESRLWLDTLENLFLSAISAYIAVAICGEAEFRLGRKDPGEIILDEVVAMPLCFLGWPLLMDPLRPWSLCLLGLALFRLFDIVKPFGIRRLQNLPGGWGVVSDDIAAALATCLVMHAAKWGWVWLKLAPRP
jgi:phosphatidylglycerophosphatase A